MTWGQLIDRWSTWMLAGNTSPETVKLRRYHLLRLAKDHPDPAAITTDDLLEWLAGKNWKPNTTRAHRATFRAFWSWAVKTGRLEASPAHDLPNVKVPRSRPRPTPEAVFRHALRVGDSRARLALMLAGVCGLRRGEIARTRREDMEPDLIGMVLRVKGKGGHVRLVPLPEELERTITRMPPGWLFPAPHGGHLTPGHIGVLVKECLVTHSTHTLRHRAGTKSYAATRDLRAVQEFLGHAQTDTTAIYTDVPASSIRAAMDGARLEEGGAA